jgi:hypothetical protein
VPEKEKKEKPPETKQTQAPSKNPFIPDKSLRRIWIAETEKKEENKK